MVSAKEEREVFKVFNDMLRAGYSETDALICIMELGKFSPEAERCVYERVAQVA